MININDMNKTFGFSFITLSLIWFSGTVGKSFSIIYSLFLDMKFIKQN